MRLAYMIEQVYGDGYKDKDIDIIEKIDQIMAEVAQEKGLDLILNEATSYGDAIEFFSSEELNITQEVLTRMIVSGNNDKN